MGYLRNSQGTVQLILIQVSLNCYSKHETKLKHLFEVNVPEDQTKTILDYYKGLCPKECQEYDVLYVTGPAKINHVSANYT